MPKVVDLDARRLEIASAAVTVIAHSGLEGARLRDVAAAAGVTTGAVTHYFLNKDEVLEAALAEVVRRYLDRMSMDQDLQPGVGQLIDRISRYLPINERAQAEWRVWLAFWGKAVNDEPLRAIHQEYYERLREVLTHLLEVSLATPETSHEWAVMADQVIACIDGVGVRACLDPEGWPAERQTRTLVAMLTPILGAVA